MDYNEQQCNKRTPTVCFNMKGVRDMFAHPSKHGSIVNQCQVLYYFTKFYKCLFVILVAWATDRYEIKHQKPAHCLGFVSLKAIYKFGINQNLI